LVLYSFTFNYFI